MRNAAIAFVMATSLPALLSAQQPAPEIQAPAHEEITRAGQPDEVIVVGNRQLMALRLGMLDAEREAYDVFNRFNDEKRFNIHCDRRQPTGSRLDVQVCEAEFEIQAKRTHARSYFENTRDMLNQFALGAAVPNENTPPVYVPPDVIIGSQQKAYRDKLKHVAEQHPEFLDALVKYADARQQYEEAVGTARK